MERSDTWPEIMAKSEEPGRGPHVAIELTVRVEPGVAVESLSLFK